MPDLQVVVSAQITMQRRMETIAHNIANLGTTGFRAEGVKFESVLAESGVRYTQFYSAATCSPTRAMLLSGMDNHLAGLGNMIERTAPNQEGQPGYEGLTEEDARRKARRGRWWVAAMIVGALVLIVVVTALSYRATSP